jgi:superoxide reductase
MILAAFRRVKRRNKHIPHQKEKNSMRSPNTIFKAECGSLVEVISGELCCLSSKGKDVPVVEKVAGGWKVTVGSVAHPMSEEHYITWIELYGDDFCYRKYLKPGQAPEAFFATDAQNVKAREYCNLHGLWAN